MQITVSVLRRGREIIMTAQDDKFLTAQDLHEYLGYLLAECPDIANKPVTLCLPQVETNENLIVKAVNEGDNSTLWLELSEKTTNSPSEPTPKEQP